MRTVVVTSATGEPVTLEEAKQHIRIEIGETVEDDLISGLITVARQRVENITGRKLMPQSWKSYYDDWPNKDYIELPYPPLRSMPSSAVVYKKSTGNSTTFSSTAWDPDTVSEPGRCILNYADDWPTATLHNNNPISIQFNCGYSTGGKVPETFKLAIKLLVGHWYENRESIIVSPSGMAIQEVPETVKSLLAPYRMHRF